MSDWNMVVYTLEQRLEVGLRSTYRRRRFWQENDLFRWNSFWSWQVCKQAKLSHLGHRKPPGIHWNADATKRDFGPVGPFFFENEQGEAVIVNGDRYRAMLNEFLFTKMEEEDIGNNWFKQDDATCHTAEATLDLLHSVFEDRIISCGSDVVWLGVAIWRRW